MPICVAWVYPFEAINGIIPIDKCPLYIPGSFLFNNEKNINSNNNKHLFIHSEITE